MDIKTRILQLLSSVKRPGMDALLNYTQTSDFFTANCNSHHFLGKGGVAQHSMEVYEFMKQNNSVADETSKGGHRTESPQGTK